jgi:uncharacterized Ntn-hydrolase superfamily protein
VPLCEIEERMYKMKEYINKESLVATFSIVGADPNTGELGIAVQSKFLAVGSVVPWAKANVGAIATQSWANTTYGPEGLKLLEQDYSPNEVVDQLVKDDPGRAFRQFAVINAKGEVSAYTGEDCFDWAGHKVGVNHSAQGNILVSEETVTAMSRTFEQSDGSLAERLLAALSAAQKAGGDSRGKQSAAIYVVQAGAGYGGYNDVKIDLRVDDHPEPIEELARLYQLHQVFFSPSKQKVEIEGNLLQDIKDSLYKKGYLSKISYDNYEGEVQDALRTYALKENFDDRWTEEHSIDLELLTNLKSS